MTVHTPFVPSIADRVGRGPHIAMRDAHGQLIIAEWMGENSQGSVQLRVKDGGWAALLDDDGTLRGVRRESPAQEPQKVDLIWVGRIDSDAFDAPVDTTVMYVEHLIAQSTRAHAVPVPADLLVQVMEALTASGHAPLARNLAAIQQAQPQHTAPTDRYVEPPVRHNTILRALGMRP